MTSAAYQAYVNKNGKYKPGVRFKNTLILKLQIGNFYAYHSGFTQLS